MLAIQGIYDGKSIQPLEKIPNNKKPSKVIITFIDEIENDSVIREFSAQSDSFLFWNDERENLYQDYLQEENE
jgi:hypothetical protein